MSVLLVMPPGGVVTGFAEHVGVGFLRAVLGRAGIAAAAYLPRGAVRLADFAAHLRATRPRLIGFTAYESNLRACRAMARAAREALPEAVLLAGGPNATFSPEETLRLLGVDGCLRGAGEGTIAAIARAVLGAEGARARLPDLLRHVPNLVLRDGDGVARTAAASLASFQREHFRHLDELPSPWQAGLLTTPAAGLITSRGCNQHCTYCSFAAISERKVAFHSVERVLEDLAAWKAHLDRLPRLPATVAILDDAFTLAPDRARAICEGIIERGLQLPFECETRVDRVDGPLLRLMRRAGFRMVAFGLESAVPRVLRAVGKVQRPDAADDPSLEREQAWLETYRRAVAAAKRAGLDVHVSVIGGLPGEEPGDFERTLDFVETLRPATYSHNLLQAMPGTPLHGELGRHGLSAARDEETGHWLTRHAHDVRAVRPRPRSTQRREGGAEAVLLADALCGRPRAGEPASGPWAVVVHGLAPDGALAAWIREVLPVGGPVVLVADGPAGAAEWRAWARALRDARAAHGRLLLLAPEEGAPGVLRCVGGTGPHRLRVDPTWRSGQAPLRIDVAGRAEGLVWLGGHPSAAPPGRWRKGDPVPQVADGCRWWTGWPRCARPAVLHVRPDRTVAACWSGPAFGEVGQPLESLLAQAGRVAQGGAGACPVGAAPATRTLRRALERAEVASQVSARVEAANRPRRRAGAGRKARPGRARRAGEGRRTT